MINRIKMMDKNLKIQNLINLMTICKNITLPGSRTTMKLL